MRFYGTLKTAAGALKGNSMRTLLTTLGIVIGVAAVITMMEIGNGATLAMQRTLQSIGSNTLVVIPGAQNVGGVNYGVGSTVTLSANDADAIARECPAVINVAPIVGARAQIVNGDKNWVPTHIIGSTPSYLQARD
jgi:ABC-type antimicrobial peptide transport system permease subunit